MGYQTGTGAGNATALQYSGTGSAFSNIVYMSNSGGCVGCTYGIRHTGTAGPAYYNKVFSDSSGGGISDANGVLYGANTIKPEAGYTIGAYNL